MQIQYTFFKDVSHLKINKLSKGHESQNPYKISKADRPRQLTSLGLF